MRSWMWMFLGTWLVASGGCNCLIDAGKYRGGPSGDGGSSADGADNIDGTAPPDGLIESDAGPIEPTSAREGEGSGTGAPPVVIVLRGGPFEAGSTASVVRSGDDTELVDGAAVVATDGSMLAIPIRIPVYDDLDETETATLAISVNGSLAANFEVDGLLEADLAGSVDTTMLRPLYSAITTSANVAFTGASPAILRSTSDITVSNNLVANGKQGGAAGPGGCRGGSAGTQGECGIGGGAGGASALVGDGGAGGGHAEQGSPGTGGAVGGQSRGNDMVTPLLNDGGNGGGGGGTGTLGVGQAGGGGGGIVELTAGGTALLDGVVNVDGGNGAISGAGVCTVSADGGSGGGSGGTILIRAWSVAGDGALHARGGAGAIGGSCNAGGDGAPGRLRIDVASQDLPAIVADPAAVRGPHWADDTASIVRDADFTATMYGEPGRTFAANIDGGEPKDVEINGSGVGSYTVMLEAGHNRICAIASPTNLTLPEAVRCMDVTYVP